MRCPRGTPYDAVTVPPAWHQWLRHTRASPPTLDEQRAEVARQARIKLLAAEADARWAAKPRLLGPDTQGSGARAALGVRAPATDTSTSAGTEPPRRKAPEGVEKGTLEETPTVAGVVADEGALRDGEAVSMREESWRRMQEEEEAARARAKVKEKEGKGERGGGGVGAPDPWKKSTRGGPSETWQPQAWEPTARPKK